MRFQVPAGMAQQTASAADPHEMLYVFTEGPRRLEVRLSRGSVYLGPLGRAQCRMDVAGRPAEARLEARNSNLDRYTAMVKWRGVHPGVDLIVTASAPDRAGIDELRRVFWTFRLPGAGRSAGQ